MSWQDRYQPRRDPEHTLRLLTPADIPAMVALAQSIGWEQQSPDLERMLYWSPEGCFAIHEAERGLVGTVTTTRYGTELGWIGMMIIAPDRQRRGLGRQLMRAALDFLITQEVQRIMLDATDAGRPLYESLGFRAVGRVDRWEGRASTYLGPRARRMQPGDVPAVLELDPVLFGVPRPHILIRLLEEFPDLAWVDYQRGRLEGYLLGMRKKHGIALGPWMSWNAASAERLLLAALERLQGETITLQIPDSNSRGLILAENHNFRRIRHCTRMIHGDATPVQGEPLAELAVTSLATG